MGVQGSYFKVRLKKSAADVVDFRTEELREIVKIDLTFIIVYLISINDHIYGRYEKE